MRILITGAAGFLCRGMVIPLAGAGHRLRLMDVVGFDSPHEVFVGDVSNADDARRAVDGVDAVIVAHMLARTEGAYDTPEGPMDVNVKGTALLFHAAREAGVGKMVLISSEAAISRHAGPGGRSRDTPRGTENGLYGLSKVLQEEIAEHYAEAEGMQVAALRVGYIVDGERCEDKYGRKVEERAMPDTDRRDIGEVARLCLEREAPGFEVFHVMSTPESMEGFDVQTTCDRLGWKPAYDFTWLPLGLPS